MELTAILSIAQAEGPAAVLGQIVGTMMANDQVALVRIWFLDQDANCPVCRNAGKSDPDDALHMRASGGRPIQPGGDWTRIDGSQHRVALDSTRPLAEMARTRKSVLIPDIASAPEAPIDREWARREQIEGIAGFPLEFRGKVVGVLVAFLRVHPAPPMLDWLSTFAAHAAIAIGNCRAFAEIELERDYLRQQLVEPGAHQEIVGASAALTRVLQQVELVAPTDSTVLITGEPGTGKELIARTIHQRSRRAGKPMLRVNSGSIPKELPGTLFLDEVGDIPLEHQSKVLQVLQAGNVRILAATNRNLRAEAEAGRFRMDLYYRLSVFPLDLPPLRDRREDIAPLADHFLKQTSARLYLPEPKLAADEAARLEQYSWPGNVRELQNVVERAVMLARGGPLHFQLDQREPAPAFVTESRWRELERENILKALEAAGGRVSGAGGAAELLGMNPNTLASRLRAFGITKTYTSHA